MKGGGDVGGDKGTKTPHPTLGTLSPPPHYCSHLWAQHGRRRVLHAASEAEHEGMQQQLDVGIGILALAQVPPVVLQRCEKKCGMKVWAALVISLTIKGHPL